MMTFFLNYFSILIPVLVSVALVTLMERKVLALIQLRKGPNKTLVEGLGQPFADAIKLFLKEVLFPFKANILMFKMGPILSLFLMLCLWGLIPVKGVSFNSMFSIIFFMMILSFGVYPLIIMGWSSNSKYAMLGAIRGISQTISYELSLALIFFNFMILSNSSSFYFLKQTNSLVSLILICPILSLLWILSLVAETNRTPFDFSEGESELVSGFNVEYSAGGFTLIFLSEYGMILFFSYLSAVSFLQFDQGELFIIFMLMLFIWIWLRGTLPRYRYDKLMNLAWKSLLPLTLCLTPFYLILMALSF